jgi:hypothetical protein
MSEDTKSYTQEQYARYVSGACRRNVEALENAILAMHGGKFFVAERKIVSVRDSIHNLLQQTLERLKLLESGTSQEATDPTSL